MLNRRLALLGLPATLPAWASARRLVLVSEVLPPYVLEAGHAAGDGMDIDIAREALRLGGGGFELELRRLPWRRALAMLETGEADFSVGVRETPERQRFLSFTRGYGAPVSLDFYVARERGSLVTAPADLAKLRIGLVAGFAYPRGLLDLLGPRVERVRDLPTLLRMAAAGRVDVAAITHLPGRWLVQELGLQELLQRQAWRFVAGDLTHMAFARASALHDEALASMNRGLARLAQSTTWTRFEAPYLRPSTPGPATPRPSAADG